MLSGLLMASHCFSIAFPISSSPSSSSSFEAAKLSKHQFHHPTVSSSHSCRALCRSQLAAANDLRFVLHDALDSSGVDTTHARAAREGFCLQIKKLSDIEKETSISINRRVDLGKTALYIAAEDDSLISHSSVPLPVDAFIDRLDDLFMDYCSLYSSSFRASPDKFLDCLERYLYVNKGFRRSSGKNHSEPRALYLHSILRNLKDAFWPFQADNSGSLFLRAAHAAYCTDISDNVEESGLELASAKAARHRLERGVWTSVRFGDMRRALSACERLILLETDLEELRDYSVLLYHCGFYEESLKYLKHYLDKKNSMLQEPSSKSFSELEKDAVEKLVVRLNLILMEESWSGPSHGSGFLSNNSEPW